VLGKKGNTPSTAIIDIIIMMRNKKSEYNHLTGRA
jgi:hypothetical protein